MIEEQKLQRATSKQDPEASSQFPVLLQFFCAMVQPVSYPKSWKTVTQLQKAYSGLQGALTLLGSLWKKGPKTLSMVPEKPAGKCETGNKFTSISLVPDQKRLPFPPKKCLLVDITPIISKFVCGFCVITYYIVP